MASPPRARVDNLPEPRRHVKVAEPASQTQYQHARRLMAEGATWGEIEAATGATWAAVQEAAYVLDDWAGFSASESARKAAMMHRIASKAMECAFNGTRTRRVKGMTAKGPIDTTTTESYADPAFARIAGEYSNPEVHSRAAGRGTAVQITGHQIAVGMIPPPPPSTLDEQPW